MKLLNRKVLALVVTLVLISSLSRGAWADSLTGWWKLDESSGSTAYDSSGNSNNGTVNGSEVWQDDGGVIDGALDFDGNGDWVNISSPGDYSTEDNFTWSAWVRLLDGQVVTNGGAIIAKSPGTGDYETNGAKCLYVAADGKLEFNVYGVGTLSPGAFVNDGLWHHVGLTVEFETSGSNDTAKLYIDGALTDGGTKSDWNVNAYSESDSLKIGFANSDFPAQIYFEGRMDDVQIYDYVLNATQIAGIFDDSGYWRFVGVGDSRGSDNGVNSSILGEIADAIIVEKAEFVVFPGDLVSGYCNQTTLQTQLIKWRDTMQPVYDAGIAVYPVRGNHDVGSPAGVTAWNNVFSDSYALPDNGPEGEVNLTYSVAHRNALIVGMDVYIEAHNVNQDWLNDVLAGNTRQHVFVFTHEPAFNARHTDGLEDDADSRDVLWSSLEDEPGCRLYFCGHDHFYDRAWIDDSDGQTEDVHQMIVGTAGAPPEDWYQSEWDEEDPYTQEQGYDHGDWTPKRQGYEGEGEDDCHGYVVVEIWGESKVTAHWKHRVDNDPDPATYEPGGDVFEYTGIMPQDTSKFYVKDDSGEAVAWFGDLGNVVLKGTLTTEVDPLEEDPDHDEFRVQDSGGNDVAIIDMTTGNMYIKGSLYEEQGTLMPPPSEGSSDFIMATIGGRLGQGTAPVAYINDSGDLYLKGQLYENSEP